MFWKKKPEVPPPDKPAASSVPSPLPPPVLSPSGKQELAKELEADNPDELTVGIGMIKAGNRELTARWFDLFTEAEIYAVGVDPDTAFVFGPKEDRNYLAVFTRRDLANKFLQEIPQLKHIMSLVGADWLRLAHKSGRGLWINPLNEACTMQFPVTSIEPLLQRMKPPSSASVRMVGGRLPVERSPVEQQLPPVLPSAQPVRLALGPSPWTWDDRSHVVAGKKYRFRVHELDGKPSSVIRILNEQDECLLLLGFCCYARFLDDGTCLLWWMTGSGDARALEFRHFALASLRALAETEALARALLKEHGHVAGLRECESLTFKSQVLPGRHSLSAPPVFAKFEETLALGHFLPVNAKPGQPTQAIFAFNWLKAEVEVTPQDWFNKGDYDFEYQWITRVARLENGRIGGDGVRLGQFELDDTGRQIDRWLNEDGGYMLR